MEGLMQLGGFLLIVGITYGPVVGLLELLNLRDRRRSRLLGSVMKALAARHLSGRIAVHVHCALLSRRSAVMLDMRACSRDEIWDAIGRMSRNLPSRVRLVVDGTMDPQVPAPGMPHFSGSFPARSSAAVR